MSTTAKQRIPQALDDLPEQSLAAVAEFAELLRAQAVAGHMGSPSARVTKLGSIWRGYAFSEQEIDHARSEVWSSLGRDPAPQHPSAPPRWGSTQQRRRQ